MKKTVVIVFAFILMLSFVGCNKQPLNGHDVSSNPTKTADGNHMPENGEESLQYEVPVDWMDFIKLDGDGLYIMVNGELMVYERYQPGTGDLTTKTVLDRFETETEIEGIVWEVYSTEEYPDLSYVLVISGTNSSWTYRVAEQ